MSVAFRLKNGSLLLSTEAPGGIYNSTQLKGIAALCEEDSAIVKVTEDQRLALFVEEDKAETIAARLKKLGLGIRHYRNGLHQPTSCIGALCSDHKEDAQGSAMAVSEALASIELDNPLRIGINGCSACCVPCHTLDISVMGDDGGYRICIGGKNTQIAEMAQFVAEGVPAAKLPGLLRKIVELYKENATGDETLQDLIERTGPSQFIDALAPYSQDAAAGGDPFDVGGDIKPASAPKEDSDDDGLDAGLPSEDDLDLSDDDLSGVTDDSGEIVGDLPADEDLSDSMDINPAEFSDLDQDLGSEVPISKSAGEDILDDDMAGLSDLEDASATLGDDVAILGDDDNLSARSKDDLGDLDAMEGSDIAALDDESIVVNDKDLESIDELESSESIDDLDGLSDDSQLIAEAGELDGTALDTIDDFEMIESQDDISASVEFSNVATESKRSVKQGHAPEADSSIVDASIAEEDSIAELEAEAVSEEDESAFEEKFNEDMDETATFAAADDEMAGDRDAAMRLVEDPSVEESANLADDDLVEVEAIADTGDLGFDEGDEEPIAEVKPIAPKAAPKSGTWSLTGFRSEGTALVLEFSSGAFVHLQPAMLQAQGERILTIGGQTLKFVNEGAAISVEADGIRLVLPRQVA